MGAAMACRVDTGAVDVGCPYHRGSRCGLPLFVLRSECFAGAVVGGHAVIPRVSDVLFGTGMGLTADRLRSAVFLVCYSPLA